MSDQLSYESRMDPSQTPGVLVAVGWLFIAFGILAVIEIIVALTQSRLSINLGVFGIFIGRGLLNLRPGWRTCGLVFIWISLILAPIFALLAFPSGNLVVLLLCGAIFLLHLWEYRVLTRPDIRRLFGLND